MRAARIRVPRRQGKKRPEAVIRLTEFRSVSGWPKVLLRLEGAALLATAVFICFALGVDWRLFALLFFFPDLSFLAYLAGPRAGAAAYNSVHTTSLPLVYGATAYWLGAPIILQIAIIHLAHIGFDRALGFGLKYETAFGDTHLGQLRRPDAAK
jgi:hypothetical protein